MDLLSGMRLFARVVETGGFTAVARESGASQPTISRTIAALEAHLGVRLLNRSSRAVTLTDDGRHFYERARGALEAVAEAESSVGPRRGEPSGLLRLGTPVAFGRLQSRAVQQLDSISQARLLMFEQLGGSIPRPFLMVLVFWICMLFLGFGLFSSPNPTTTVALLVGALSVACAIFLLLELNDPYRGLMRISDEPLRNAMAQIDQ